MKTLSISLYNRPKYTRTVLEHLDRCFDIENYFIYIYCEPDNSDIISIAKNFRTSQTNVYINDTRLGCNKNIYQCLSKGFENNDFHIHLEDDTVPGKDFLLYCDYCNGKFKDDLSVFSISGYVNSNNSSLPQYYTKNNNYFSFSKRNWFTPWGWATWNNRWENIKNAISDSVNTPNVSWDVYVHKILNNNREVFPLVSRIQNIGAENGTYCPSSEWHYNNQYNDYWIETEKAYISQDTYLNEIS